MPDEALTARMHEMENQLEHTKSHLDLMMSLSSVATEPGDAAYFVRRSLEIIARSQGWVIGQYWLVKPGEEVAVCSDWYYSSVSLSSFRYATMECRFSKGVGLTGRIWSTGLPLYIPDVQHEMGLAFPRKADAAKAGLKSAYGFAIKSGPFVTGIYEFLSFDAMLLPDSDHLFYEKLGVYLATLIAQRDAEEEAHKKELFSRAVLDHARDAFVGINEASLITEWTQRAADLFGWTKEEVLGKPLADIVIPERYRIAHMRGLFHYMTTKEGPILNKTVKAPGLHKQGHEIPIELTIFPIKTRSGTSFGAFIVDLSKIPAKPNISLD